MALLEPYYTGSHRLWADGWQHHSRHQITLLTMSGSHWKWRMQGGAVTLARRWNDLKLRPDIIVAGDMLHLPLFLSLTRATTAHLPCVLYFHENQLAYPMSEKDTDALHGRDRHYGFINYTSALSADAIWFNSAFNKNSMLQQLPGFLGVFPDHQELPGIATLQQKSYILPVGMDLPRRNAAHPVRQGIPVIGWNHRWEHDKHPEAFYRLLKQVQDMGIDFGLILLGEPGKATSALYRQLLSDFEQQIVHAGFAENRDHYLALLSQCDFLPVTSHHDFFGISVCEAMALDVHPLLPNRLAYPEHIPISHQSIYLYDDDDDLFYKLVDRCRNVAYWRTQSIAHWMEAYDWTTLAPVYDAALEEVAGRINNC